MRDIDLIKNPGRGIEFLSISIASAYRDTAFVIFKSPYLSLAAITIGTVISLWRWSIFSRVGYGAPHLMAMVGFITIAVQVMATLPLVFRAHRLLLPETAAPHRVISKGFAAPATYLGISIFLFSMNNLDFMFCLLGNSQRGPGLMAAYILSFMACLLWIRIIAIFPALSVGDGEATLGEAVERIKGRTFQVALTLALGLFPIVLILYPGSYAILVALLHKIGGPANTPATSDAVGFALHSFIFIVTWVLVASVGSSLYHGRIGQDRAADNTTDPNRPVQIHMSKAWKTEN